MSSRPRNRRKKRQMRLLQSVMKPLKESVDANFRVEKVLKATYSS